MVKKCHATPISAAFRTLLNSWFSSASQGVYFNRFITRINDVFYAICKGGFVFEEWQSTFTPTNLGGKYLCAESENCFSVGWVDALCEHHHSTGSDKREMFAAVVLRKNAFQHHHFVQWTQTLKYGCRSCIKIVPFRKVFDVRYKIKWESEVHLAFIYCTSNIDSLIGYTAIIYNWRQ